MEKIKWVNKARNDEVLRRIGEDRRILAAIKKRKRNWLGHWLRRKNVIIKDALEGMVSGKRGRGRRKIQLLGSIKVENYKRTKESAENKIL